MLHPLTELSIFEFEIEGKTTILTKIIIVLLEETIFLAGFKSRAMRKFRSRDIKTFFDIFCFLP